MSKAKLKELFTVFASFHEQSMINKVGKRKLGEEGKRFIDIDLFIEMLTTIALSQRSLSKGNNEGNIYDTYFIKVIITHVFIFLNLDFVFN